MAKRSPDSSLSVIFRPEGSGLSITSQPAPSFCTATLWLPSVCLKTVAVVELSVCLRTTAARSSLAVCIKAKNKGLVNLLPHFMVATCQELLDVPKAVEAVEPTTMLRPLSLPSPGETASQLMASATVL